VALLQRNRFDVPTAARLVADHIAAARLNSPVIVAHSKGGLIGKYVMLALDPDERIDRMIAVCTPFSGSRRVTPATCSSPASGLSHPATR
jgi:alpha-beta hydrolase superfamily lysophospholipase